MLTTHPLLVPRLRKSRSYTSCHPNAPLWSVTGPLYTFFYHCRKWISCFIGVSQASDIWLIPLLLCVTSVDGSSSKIFYCKAKCLSIQTAWNRVLEKPLVPQPLKKFLAFSVARGWVERVLPISTRSPYENPWDLDRSRAFMLTVLARLTLCKTKTEKSSVLLFVV
jgi:hypothetical protein